MEYHRTGDTLKVRLLRDFNLLTARRMEPLAREVQRVEIDLTHSKLVDSEAITLLYRLITAGKQVQIFNPPPLFFEVIRILELEDFFKLDQLVNPPRLQDPSQDLRTPPTPTD